MKLIALLASPHGQRGNTAGLLRLVLDGAEGEGARAEVIVLRGSTVLPCRGCDTCHKKGYCAQKDEFEAIKEKIIAADGLVLASPNYIYSVSAQLKAFMDRCCGVVHCMGFWGKYGASVVTSGGSGEEHILGYMNHFLLTTGAVPVGGVSAVMSAMPEGGFTPEVEKKAHALGKRVVSSWRERIVPARVEKERNEFRERMRDLMAWRKEEWPYEYNFWQKRKNPL
jgi:multimeric flavodoxin WrbA